MRKVISAVKFTSLQQKEQRLELARDACSHRKLFLEPVIPIQLWIWRATGLITQRILLLMKDVILPKGTIVETRAVVTKTFNEENTVIEGNPAKIIKKNVQWKHER